MGSSHESLQDVPIQAWGTEHGSEMGPSAHAAPHLGDLMHLRSTTSLPHAGALRPEFPSPAIRDNVGLLTAPGAVLSWQPAVL